MGKLKSFLPLIFNLALGIGVITIDQFTKGLSQRYLDYGTPHPIIPGFNLTLLYNSGAAFSLGANSQYSWVLISINLLICTGIIWTLCKQKNLITWFSISLTLILAGALSNLIDRITYGYVTDFLDFYFKQWHWPVFNMADTAIVLGVILAGLNGHLTYEKEEIL